MAQNNDNDKNEASRVQALLTAAASHCRVAGAYDKVLNSECCFTFHSPYTTDQGILVNLRTFCGTIQPLALLAATAASTTGNQQQQYAFVRIVKKRVEKAAPTTLQDDKDEKAVPTKLGIGIKDGFAAEEDKYETLSTHSVVLLEPNRDDALHPTVVAEVPYNESTKSSFPEFMQKSVDSILCHAGLTTQQDVMSWQLDQSDVPVSKYANDSLPFVDNGVLIDPDPRTWKCQSDGTSTENLWLNLSDGYIGGGRKNWDGSGGSNGALDHYEATGRQYPLVVKLGTITADLETADCYSYAPDEDGPVRIPNLAALLQKRGIQIAAMQKTVKSTAELEVELNANYAFDAITEAGAHLTPVSGPGLQGLQNLGNSCYMNSVLQLLFSGTVPELANRYGTAPSTTTNNNNNNALERHVLVRAAATLAAPQDDLLGQTAKVASALTSGVFAQPLSTTTTTTSNDDNDNNKKDDTATSTTDPKYRLAPRMFKHVIGKDHVDFCTGQQQDAAQFLQYLLERLDRAEMAAPAVVWNKTTTAAAAAAATAADNNNPLHVASHLFQFSTTTRLVCRADQKIKYTQGAPETMWSLRIPMDKAQIVTTSVERNEKDKEEEAPEQKRHKTAATATKTSDDEDDKANKLDADDPKKKQPVPKIAFSTCLEEWASETTVTDIRWPHLGNATHPATQTMRFTNFPRYLLVQMQRYQLGPDWQPVKLEVEVEISDDDELDLNVFKAPTGPVEGEKLVPEEEEEEPAASAKNKPKGGGPVLDEAALSQLMDMGFSLNSCKRALTAVGGSSVEAAMGWVFEHNTDPDFNDPLPEDDNDDAMDTSGDDNDGGAVDEGVVQSLVASLGCFTADQVRVVLKETNGAPDRAADWLFSHMDDLDAAIAALDKKGGGDGAGGSSSSSSNTPKVPLEDGNGKYSLVGMVSHIGKHTGSGHYVAHLKKNGGKWTIFNDEKVALSSEPPFAHAYLYLFQRTDTIGSPNPNY